jgi:drug/metabolite transporter (DMT)-like permease
MTRLIALGSLAALFFSSGFMLIFLVVILLVTQGKKALAEVKDVFIQHWRFWILAGSIGFGVFYSLITFSSQYAAGWIVATTWQTTILASPLVLVFFGRRVPTKGLLFTGIIFAGILLVNIEHATLTGLREVLLSALPILVAAFAYPIGNQLVWEARLGHHPRIPKIDHPILENGFARVLLLTLGSIPFWTALLLFTSPPAPSSGQLLSTALVALLSGVIATTLFLYARHLCKQPYEIAAVDATQSMEVVFSLLGEILFLGGAVPGALGLAGVGLTILGLAAYMRTQVQ